MVRLSRYILILVAIIAGAVAIPKLYWIIFEKPIRSPFIMYSCVDNGFMIQRSGSDMVRTDLKGNTYTREEFEAKLPLMYSMQLASSGLMPDSINGVEMDLHEIRKNRSTFRYRPANLHSPQPGLYPMFESESERVRLEMPLDYFRVKGRMEFIVAKSNKIDEEKSQKFTYFMQKKGFVFPAKLIAGLPTTRKSCDEGYFIIDANDQLFHVKMIEGHPYVRKVDLPENLKFKQISCVDFSDKLYYAYLISESNGVYILTQDEYKLIRFPIDGFDADKDQLKIYGDIFHYNVIIDGSNYVKVYVLDRQYKYVDYYEETWKSNEERIEGKIFSVLFPGQISMEDENSNYINFCIKLSKGYWWILLSICLIVTQVLIARKRKVFMRNQILDLAIIFFTGIFGFIAVNIFQNKFYK